MEAKVCGVKSSSSGNHHQMIAVGSEIELLDLKKSHNAELWWVIVNVNICFVCLQENSTEPCPQLKIQDVESPQMLEFWDTKTASDCDSLEFIKSMTHKINRLDERSSDVSRIWEQNISQWMCLEIKLKHRTWHALFLTSGTPQDRGQGRKSQCNQCKSTVHVSYILHKLQSKSTFRSVVHIR